MQVAPVSRAKLGLLAAVVLLGPVAWKRRPNSVNSTTSTEPGDPLGVSLCSATTRSTRESGKMDA